MTDTIDWPRQLFVRNREFARATKGDLPRRHDPDVVTISCCDARVPQNAIFGTEPGENFTVAKIGNVVSERDASGDWIASGSVLYPIRKTSPECAVVIGHTDCGAVTAAYQQVAEGAEPEGPALQNELDGLVPIVEAGLDRLETGDHSRDETITRLVEYNVDRQVETLCDEAREIPVLGVVFDIHGYYGASGECHLVNYNGERDKGRVPESLRRYHLRKLEY